MTSWKRLGLRAVSPRWLVMVACLAIVVLGYFGWQAVAGREADPGPPKKVYPGMYDLRAEVAKMRAAKAKEASPHGP